MIFLSFLYISTRNGSFAATGRLSAVYAYLKGRQKKNEQHKEAI